MSIAQRFVAGEGEAHPDDAAALTAFRCDSTNLPWVVFRAAFRAAHIEEISARGRAVLSALARTVDANKPFAAIFARRELLTGRALQSMRTFYRSLADLESAGLIDRRAQSRYVEAGLFGRAYIHLTERAATILGLVDDASAPSSSTEASTFQSPSANVADGGKYKDLSPSTFQKRQPGSVPADLQRLRTLGFIDFLIFKLMREARENGKRLSDVVEATWEHLKLAKAPINYLRALLRSTVDFTHQIRSRAEAEAAELARVKQKDDADRIARECAGQTFVDVSGEHTYTIDADGETMVVHKLAERMGRQAAGWQQGFARARAQAKLRLATAADLELFARARRVDTNENENLERPPVTAQIREHIAGLRDLLSQRHVKRTA